MILKVKSLIYPLLFSQPTFLPWTKTNSLEKQFDININNDNYNATGHYIFISRYSDKTSINGKHYHEIKCKLKIHYNEDVYCEKINQKLYCLINDNRPYHSIDSYILKKNDKNIKKTEIDISLLKVLFFEYYGNDFNTIFF